MSVGRGEPMPAVVLSTRPLGEADLLVVLVTPNLGKVRTAAKAARRSRRRFPGGIAGGAVGRATIAPSRGSLRRLEAFEPELATAGRGQDLQRFAYVAYLCELTDLLLVEPEPAPTLFAELRDAVIAASTGKGGPVALRRYELALLSATGHRPALAKCCVCGLDLPADLDPIPFSPVRGGALCSTHADASNDTVPAAVVALTKLLVATPWGAGLVDEVAAAVEAAGPEDRRGLRDLTQILLRQHLRRPLRSLEFFRKLGPGVTDPKGPTRG